MKINYTKQGDYLIPNLRVEEVEYESIGRYGILKLNYLKEHNKVLYKELLIKNVLTNYLISVDNECKNKFNVLMKNYKNNDKKLSENNKKLNQLEWVKLMNNYKILADEIIIKENIYDNK